MDSILSHGKSSRLYQNLVYEQKSSLAVGAEYSLLQTDPGLFYFYALVSPGQKPVKHNLVRGVRKASDFLMALQLTGAFKRNALPNLQARLPAVVIGGGLTGIDTATELFAYYPIQVEKTLDRYEKLVAEKGAAAVRASCDAEELAILDEFLAHGRAVRAERQRAERGGRGARLRHAGPRDGAA